MHAVHEGPQHIHCDCPMPLGKPRRARFHYRGRLRGKGAARTHTPPSDSLEVDRLRARIAELERALRPDRLQHGPLRDAFEATGIGLWNWQPETDSVVWDEAMCRLHGRPAPRSAAAYALECVYPDDRREVIRRWEAVAGSAGRTESGRIESGRIDMGPYRIVRPSGEVRWVVSSACATTDAGGRVVTVLGGTLDFTRHRAREEQLRHAQKMESIGNL